MTDLPTASKAETETRVRTLIRDAIHSRPDAAAGAGAAVEGLALATMDMLRFLGNEVRALRRELGDLRQQVAGLAEAKSIPYAGTWKSGQSYAAGAWVTSSGSLWLATEATSARPGDGSTPWKLVVKKGRDGRR